MPNKDEILLSAIESLKTLIESKKAELVKLEKETKEIEEKQSKLNVRMEFFEAPAGELEKLVKEKNTIENRLKSAERYKVSFANDKKAILDFLQFVNPLFNVENFAKNIHSLDAICTYTNLDDFLVFMNILAKATGVKFPLSRKDFEMYNLNITKALDCLTFHISHLTSISIVQLNIIRSELYKILSKYDYNGFHKKLASFINEVCLKLKDEAHKTEDKITEYVNNIASTKSREFNTASDALKERNNNKSKVQSEIKELESVLELYSTYNNNPSNENLTNLCNLLVKFNAMSSRDAKLIAYEKKVAEVATKEEEAKPKEEPKTEISTDIPPLDADYFTRPNTQNIICFLGTLGDDILSDIDDQIDNSRKPIIFKELVSMFYKLYHQSNSSIPYGHGPGSSSPRKVLALLDPPLSFIYRKYGVKNDPFRIHTITRHSDLLKRLGYGTGDLIFFGAIGVNDANDKAFTFGRVGNRTIATLTRSGAVPILKGEFDTIEHISRGYVPLAFLSVEDRDKKKRGQFNGKFKGTDSEKSIEFGKYVLYDALSDESKENVKKYLDNYFYEQSTKMFDIIKEFDNISKAQDGAPLD